MTFNPEIHHRRSIRLKGHDYSRGGIYFLTLCACNRERIFGKIETGKMILNKFGEIAKNELLQSAHIRNEIELDEFVIMPDHVHVIVIINDLLPDESVAGANGHTPLQTSPPHEHSSIVAISSRHNDVPPTGKNIIMHNVDQHIHMKQKSISSFIVGYKSSVKILINSLRGTPGVPVWQRNYYDHIIRDEFGLDQTRQYILRNPEISYRMNPL